MLIIAYLRQIASKKCFTRDKSAHTDIAQRRDCRLSNKYRRHAVFELVVARLVVKHAHTRVSADRAADSRKQYKRAFRYAPCAAFGPALVEAIADEGDKVYQYQVDCQSCLHWCPPMTGIEIMKPLCAA